MGSTQVYNITVIRRYAMSTSARMYFDGMAFDASHPVPIPWCYYQTAKHTDLARWHIVLGAIADAAVTLQLRLLSTLR